MWDLQKRQRFQELRARAERLSAAEQAELSAMTCELESTESAYLNGASQRLQRDRELIEQQNRKLELLVARKSALIQRLDTALADARAERSAINSELALMMAGSNGSSAEQ